MPHRGLGARFDSEVAENEPIVEREVARRGPGELQRVIFGAVGAERRDESERDVLRGDSRRA
jgi:hypothetical protein